MCVIDDIPHVSDIFYLLVTYYVTTHSSGPRPQVPDR